MSSKYAIAFLFVVAIAGCDTDTPPERPTTPEVPTAVSIPMISYSVVSRLPHDTTAFTEGLLLHDGQLYESTGAAQELPQTRSLFGVVSPQTGRIAVKAELNRVKYFGEGITFLNGKVYQLTYQTKVGFIYDAKTFKKLGEFSFPSREGWGMTTDGSALIMSDGTPTLTWLSPDSMKPLKTITVTDDAGPVANINELEYINGAIWANIYTTNTIIRIDPATGKVTGRVDATELANEARQEFGGSLEMNGLAWDPAAKKLYATGKLWPRIFELQLGQ